MILAVFWRASKASQNTTFIKRIATVYGLCKDKYYKQGEILF